MPGAVYFDSHEHLERRRKGNILDLVRFPFFLYENLMTVQSDGSWHPPWPGGGKGLPWALRHEQASAQPALLLWYARVCWTDPRWSTSKSIALLSPTTCQLFSFCAVRWARTLSILLIPKLLVNFRELPICLAQGLGSKRQQKQKERQPRN